MDFLYRKIKDKTKSKGKTKIRQRKILCKSKGQEDLTVVQPPQA
jgi:hypothetical protein